MQLRAYQADNLSQITFTNGSELPAGVWDSLFTIPSGAAFYDAGGPYFEPMVINGRVYVGSDTQVTVFGL